MPRFKALFASLVAIAAIGCSASSPLIGTWKDAPGDETLVLRINGTYTETRVDPKIGTITLDGRYDASDKQLTLAAQDLAIQPSKGNEEGARHVLATPGLKAQMLGAINADNPLKYQVLNPDSLMLTRVAGGTITLQRVKG